MAFKEWVARSLRINLGLSAKFGEGGGANRAQNDGYRSC